MRSRLALVAVLSALLIASVALAAYVARLDGGTCTPSTGSTATTFRYAVTYFGPEPSIHDVHIDAGVFHMNKVSTTATGGAVYVYETKLAAGAHKYRFRFQCGTLALRRPGPTAQDWFTGPTVTQATETYTISGLIKSSDVALAGVEVKLRRNDVTVKTATTNAEGRYTFSGLTAGTYVVLPTKSGYRMDPLSKLVTVGPSTTTCNFRAIKQ